MNVETPALPLFKRAVQLDPNFAMAYARMGTVYSNLGEAAMAAESGKKAYDLRERVTERERLYIDSHYYDFVLGDSEKAAQVYEQWKQTYPRDQIPYINLSSIESNLGQYEKAVEGNQEALRLEPDNVINYANVANSYLELSRLDEAKAMLDEAQRRNLESQFLLQTFYLLAFLRNDPAEMERVLSAAMGKPGTEDVILSAQSDTEAYHGRLSKARELTQRAVDSAVHNDAKETAAGWQINAALREAEFGNLAQAKQQANAGLDLAKGEYEEALVALVLARTGDAAKAQAMADDLGKQFSSATVLNGYWLPSIRAAIELSRNNSARAIEILQVTTPYEIGSPPPFSTIGTLYPVYLRGQAYLAAKNGTAAAAEFQKFLDHPGTVANFPFATLARLQLGRAYTMSGDAVKAKGAYQDFFAFWKDADPDIPVLVQARAEYAKLR